MILGAHWDQKGVILGAHWDRTADVLGSERGCAGEDGAVLGLPWRRQWDPKGAKWLRGGLLDGEDGAALGSR